MSYRFKCPCCAAPLRAEREPAPSKGVIIALDGHACSHDVMSTATDAICRAIEEARKCSLSDDEAGQVEGEVWQIFNRKRQPRVSDPTLLAELDDGERDPTAQPDDIVF